MGELTSHLDNWLLDKQEHGNGVPDDMLFQMVLEVLPDHVAKEVRLQKDISTYKDVIKYVDKEVIKYVEKPVVEYVEKPVVKYVDKEVVKWVEKEVIKYVDREVVRIEKPKETPFTYCPRGQGECRLGQGNNVTISDILCQIFPFQIH